MGRAALDGSCSAPAGLPRADLESRRTASRRIEHRDHSDWLYMKQRHLATKYRQGSPAPNMSGARKKDGSGVARVSRLLLGPGTRGNSALEQGWASEEDW